MAADAELTPGCLWMYVEKATAHALECGALQPIPTDFEVIDDQGMQFVVRIVSNLVRKEKAKARQEKDAQQGKPANPFLPYERDLFVCHLSPSHLCLLNKYNVVDHHLLIITRHYEFQETWLTEADFVALAACMREIQGLGFYNSGKAAGASQHHKHLQLVPLPLAPSVPDLPISRAIAPQASRQEVFPDQRLPFQCGVQILGLDWSQAPEAIATTLLAAYRDVMQQIGVSLAAEVPEVAYNLLVTRQWMLAVPRSQESYQGIPVNSLGYAGSLLVKTEADLDRLKQIGPMHLLRRVGVAQ